MSALLILLRSTDYPTEIDFGIKPIALNTILPTDDDCVCVCVCEWCECVCMCESGEYV